jgi:outer membrane protein TolC
MQRSPSWLVVITMLLVPGAAAAQPAHQGRGARPAPPPPAEAPKAPHVVQELVTVVPNGLTAEQAGKRALATSYSAKAAEETAAAASARVDQAAFEYVPDVTLTAAYTRLSPITAPQTSTSNGVATLDPGGTINPQTFATTPPTPLDIVDEYVLRADIVVPISDYLLKVNQAYSAASQSAEAARLDVTAARAVAFSNAKQAYYEWLRAVSAVTVASQTLAVAQAHASDAKVQFGAGAVAAGDLMRAESDVAAAELAVERAKALAAGREWTLRTYIHAADSEQLQAGESLDGPVEPIKDKENVQALLKEAFESRAELKSLERSAEASRKLAAAARAGRIPTLSAVGDLTYANPNERRIPIQVGWFPSWSVGAQLTWSPKNFLVGGSASAAAESKAAAIEAQKIVARETIIKDVVDAYNAAIAADVALSTTTRQLDSAQEAYRVARQLYTNGRATATVVLDAESALERARFDHLNARADARVSRVLLTHAVGRDLREVSR